MASIKDIGKRIYDLKNPREKRRYFVFLLRSLVHRKELRELVEFFQQDAARKQILEVNPFPIFPRHFTVPDNRHIPQQMSRFRYEDMLSLAQRYPDYVVFYNGRYTDFYYNQFCSIFIRN